MSQPLVGRLSPQGLGIVCAVSATALGLVYLALADAPVHLLGINAAGLVLGLVALMALRHTFAPLEKLRGPALLVIAFVLLATALIGETADGATRWIAVGSLFVQPSLIFLPLLVVSYARNQTTLATLAMMTAALAMAIQPDRAMAGLLLAGVATQAFLRPGKHVNVALLGSLAAFVVAVVRPDALPAVPYVDQIFFTAFDVSFSAGMAVVGGALLLLAPALAGMRRGPQERHVCIVFGAVWLAAILAALLGNYPTPVVGYSGAAVLGYTLSLLALPSARASSVTERKAVTSSDEEQSESDRHAHDLLQLNI